MMSARSCSCSRTGPCSSEGRSLALPLHRSLRMLSRRVVTAALPAWRCLRGGPSDTVESDRAHAVLSAGEVEQAAIRVGAQDLLIQQQSSH